MYPSPFLEKNKILAIDIGIIQGAYAGVNINNNYNTNSIFSRD